MTAEAEVMPRRQVTVFGVSEEASRLERDSVEAEEETSSDPVIHTGDLVAGRYRIERMLGRGGHGAVYRAIHEDLDLAVALKVIHVAAFADPEQLTLRFIREARIAARLRHRNILSVYDTGRLPDGSPFLVMELIHGEDLAERILRGPIGIPGVVDLGRQLFAGLTAIEDANVLHRDVKPANLMLHRETDGQVLLKLVDFGIARARGEEGKRLTVTGAVIGTPHYMSPEQLRGEELDSRADLYAACAALYEATTGVPPFDGSSAAHVVGQILAGRLPPVRELRPDCPADLAALIERGLSRKREDRPSHPVEFVSALERITRAAGLPTGALAWAEDPGLSQTLPLVLSRRRAVLPPDESMRMPTPIPESPGTRDSVRSAPPGEIPSSQERHRWRAPLIGALAVTFLSLAGGALLGFSTQAQTPAPPPTHAAIVSSPSTPAAFDVPDVNVLLARGLEALTQGEVEAALGHYRAAVAADPSRPESQRGRGLAAARAGFDDEATLAFERYLRLAPDAPDASRVRAQLDVQRARRRERLGAGRAP